MFTWICPQCGKEVQPHETECPYCKAAAEKQSAPQTTASPLSAPSAPSPPPPQAAATPAARPSPKAPTAPQQQPVYQVGGTRSGIPGWLVTLLVAAILIGGTYVVYRVWFQRSSPQTVASGESPFEEVPQAGESTAGNRLNRYIEATGFRITEDNNKRLLLQFLIVNHSEADIGDLAGTVHVKTTESDDEIASVDFKTTGLGPYESIEFKAVMSTSMRAYEAPDWQFLRGVVEVTSPPDY